MNLLMNCPHCNHPLTSEEVVSLNAQRSSSMIRKRSGGTKPSCSCGQCTKCRRREAMRRWRKNRMGRDSNLKGRGYE
jgi:hypothetical protein